MKVMREVADWTLQQKAKIVRRWMRVDCHDMYARPNVRVKPPAEAGSVSLG
jgi:hypothetical protein